MATHSFACSWVTTACALFEAACSPLPFSSARCGLRSALRASCASEGGSPAQTLISVSSISRLSPPIESATVSNSS
ncbi:hypothetical protein T492DRAFT_977509 [Pavlovales sp. CCMP2436]|nr:hypothetical protein T492DRAFT_977509 [Pavlovales sp. CCMP2436]